MIKENKKENNREIRGILEEGDLILIRQIQETEVVKEGVI